MRLHYLKKVLRHKWYVFRVGVRLGVPLSRLLRHDWTKFLPSEFMPYVRHFEGQASDTDGFNEAWQHHIQRNDHHWEHWLTPEGPLPMPEEAIREMVADWLSASKVYDGAWPDMDNYQWLNEHRHKLIMHTSTWLTLNAVLSQIRTLKLD